MKGGFLMADTERLKLLRELNPHFAELEANGDPWALRQAEMVRGIEGQASRRFPERTMKEDGKPHNFCGCCPHPEGCMMCDLPYNHEFSKSNGPYRTN
jgi:hypothetical protein